MGIPSVGRVGEERRIKEIRDKVSGLEESMEKIINTQVGLFREYKGIFSLFIHVTFIHQVSLVTFFKQNKLLYSQRTSEIIKMWTAEFKV